MQIVQLGIFQDVFDWVYEHLLDPMWEFVSGLLSAGFEYLSEAIPVVINAVMGTILGEVISLVLDWYYKKWFLLQSAILLLLDCIEDCFNVVSGIRPVYVKTGVTSAGGGEAMPMLYAVFRQDMIRNAFLAMIVVGFSLCFGMAILATARSFFELGGENTKPVTHVIKMTAKSLLYLALAPLMAVALIMLSQAILTSIDRALTAGNDGKRTSIARIVFCISSLDAIDTFWHPDGEEYNVSYTDGPSKASVTDKFRKEFYYEDDHWLIPNYTNILTVRKTFTIHGFDYWIGIGCGMFFTCVMCMVLAVFIGRIMDVMVLLVIQPFFVAMMPFDDGEYYKKWFELFIGKLFQGFGSVIAMRVYLMILEQLFAGNISFSNSKSLGARLQDYLMMLLFAMGGAVAVRHIGPLVTGILSQAAASGEQMAGAAGWKVGAAIANKEASFAKKMAKGDVKKLGKMIGGGVGEIMKFNQRRGGGAGGAGGPGGPGGAAGAPGGKFEGNGAHRIAGAQSLKGNFTDEAAASNAQKSLASMKASVVGSEAYGSMPKSKGTERMNSRAESSSLNRMRASMLGAGVTNTNPSGADKGGKTMEDMVGGSGSTGSSASGGGPGISGGLGSSASGGGSFSGSRQSGTVPTSGGRGFDFNNFGTGQPKPGGKTMQDLVGNKGNQQNTQNNTGNNNPPKK